ncbi:MAG: ABC transporter ATP-binding protein [Parvibaculaceae bacterium]
MKNVADTRPGNAPAGARTSAEAARAAVRVEGASKRFGPVVALKETFLSIEQGTFMTLLGPSGCGKTTLLNLISGFTEADSGEIYLNGNPITDTPPYRRNVGMVFQNYALFPHMNVAQNVGYGLRMRRVARAEVASRVARALEIVKLTGYEDRRPRELSGGQQQRVAIARAIVIDPLVLLLDEPLSALDKSLRASMQLELKDIQTRLGITTIFVTHDQGEALSLSDRIAVMAQGEIRQIGTPEEIYRQPQDAFVASFIGDINRMIAHLERVERDTALLKFNGGEIEVPARHLTDSKPGAAYDVFVRPERLAVTDAGNDRAIRGTVERHVYQGSHVDMYVASPASVSGSLHIRLQQAEAMTRWPTGTSVAITLDPESLLMFPKAD